MMLSTFPGALDVTYASVLSTTLLSAFGVFLRYADDVRLMYQDIFALLNVVVERIMIMLTFSVFCAAVSSKQA